MCVEEREREVEDCYFVPEVVFPVRVQVTAFLLLPTGM